MAKGKAAKAKHLEAAAEVVEICQRYMPNTEATKAAFRKEGYAVAEATSSHQLFKANGWNVVVQLQNGGGGNQICAIRVANMTPDQAVILAQPWVQKAKARQQNNVWDEAAAVWRGKIGPDEVAIVVYKKLKSPKIRGSAVKLDFKME
ncbi:MAG: hypothetical protein AAGA63_12815 [Pseudomonadota bacterium]